MSFLEEISFTHLVGCSPSIDGAVLGDDMHCEDDNAAPLDTDGDLLPQDDRRGIAANWRLPDSSTSRWPWMLLTFHDGVGKHNGDVIDDEYALVDGDGDGGVGTLKLEWLTNADGDYRTSKRNCSLVSRVVTVTKYGEHVWVLI